MQLERFRFAPALVGVALALAAPTATLAQSDTSSAESFVNTVSNSSGVMIRVPINERGEELTSRAEIRVDVTPGGAPTDFVAEWNRAVDGTSQPVVDVNSDSSTDSSSESWYGWYPYRSYYNYNYGYYPGYYYNSYYPRYYWGYNNYWYNRPYYYSNYYNNYNYGYYGHRYYWYNRWWR